MSNLDGVVLVSVFLKEAIFMRNFLWVVFLILMAFLTINMDRVFAESSISTFVSPGPCGGIPGARY